MQARFVDALQKQTASVLGLDVRALQAKLTATIVECITGGKRARARTRARGRRNELSRVDLGFQEEVIRHG